MNNGRGFRVLVVDDEPLKRITLHMELTEAGFQVLDSADGRAAIRRIDAHTFDAVVTDLKLPDMSGLDLIEQVKSRYPGTAVIVMTAYGEVDTAVAAMQRGAHDYLCKPFPTDMLIEKLEIIRRQQLLHAHDHDAPERFGHMIGHSAGMKNLFREIERIAETERTVLIEGESGTGKELVAEILCRRSRRADRPFVRFACAALQPTVLESELFGHEKGAFTGAIRQKAGRFELAHGGTMFLDEVDDIAPEIQVKLLRAVEQKEFERVGGEQLMRVDVRLICATKKNLRELVDAGRFREDLYYRLNVILLRLPPLRERREDILPLARHFIAKHSTADETATDLPTIAPDVLERLLQYDWPGNVRELEHVIERALTFCDADEIRLEHLPALNWIAAPSRGDGECPQPVVGLVETVADVERAMIESALRQAGGNQAKAAEVLRIPRTTLRDKLAKYRILSKQTSPPDA